MSQWPPSLATRRTGGASRSRTDLHGFAIRCITALLSRRSEMLFNAKRKLSSRRQTGAAEESRTLDLNLGKVALYQLSYCRVKQSAHYRLAEDLVNIVRLLFCTALGNFGPSHAQVIAHGPQGEQSGYPNQPVTGQAKIETKRWRVIK